MGEITEKKLPGPWPLNHPRRPFKGPFTSNVLSVGTLRCILWTDNFKALFGTWILAILEESAGALWQIPFIAFQGLASLRSELWSLSKY